ncbi:MAG: hypothetical protein HYZ26_05120 [Chloroflexi bacterium]|nr:hypothetical protein [Chloroflexota bacterium]
MNVYKTYSKVIGLALVMGLLLGCGAASSILVPTATPEPTATPAPLAKPGHWEGDPEVSFDVSAEGTVSNFTMLVAGDCRVKINTTIRIGGGDVLVIGNIGLDGKPFDNGIVGRFDSSTHIQGTIASPYVCGSVGVISTYYLPEALTGWSAEWVGP